MPGLKPRRWNSESTDNSPRGYPYRFGSVFQLHEWLLFRMNSFLNSSSTSNGAGARGPFHPHPPLALFTKWYCSMYRTSDTRTSLSLVSHPRRPNRKGKELITIGFPNHLWKRFSPEMCIHENNHESFVCKKRLTMVQVDESNTGDLSFFLKGDDCIIRVVHPEALHLLFVQRFLKDFSCYKRRLSGEEGKKPAFRIA